MTVRLVATLGHPILREWACPLAPDEIEYPATQALIEDLIATMRYYQGAGLAAPQVMTSDRIASIEVHGIRATRTSPRSL